MVSSPLIPGYNQSLPGLYSFENGTYRKADSLVAGKGYWAKPGDSAVTYVGKGLTDLEISLTTGWNLVGMILTPVPSVLVTTDPDSIIASPFYEYTDEQYAAADTLRPGRRYWVKVSLGGVLRIEE
jgi:hypothetical protein